MAAHDRTGPGDPPKRQTATATPAKPGDLLWTLVAYVITIPQATSLAPHQNTEDCKYYRRFEFQSVPMYDYEIRDILRRATTPELWIDFTFDNGKEHTVLFDLSTGVSHPIALRASIGNKSKEPALYAVITIYIDDVLNPMCPLGFTEVHGRLPYRGHSLKMFSINWGIPKNMLIFKENMFDVTKTTLSVDATSGRIPEFYIGYDISAPGFSVAKRLSISH